MTAAQGAIRSSSQGLRCQGHLRPLLVEAPPRCGFGRLFRDPCAREKPLPALSSARTFRVDDPLHYDSAKPGYFSIETVVEFADPLSSPAAIERWSAVNQEILALARAGLPIEPGLRAAATEMLARDSAKTRQVADALAAGGDLADALKQAGVTTSPAYLAAIRAGQRTGRLAAAIEGMVEAASAAEALARQWRLAAWHPWFVLVLGVGAIVITRTYSTEPVAQSLRDLDLPSTFLETLIAWWPWSRERSFLIGVSMAVPIIALILVRWFSWGLAWWGIAAPWAKAKRIAAQSFQSDLLALLLEHEVPLPEALALSGDASGHAALAAASREASQRLARGGDESRPSETNRSPTSPFSLGVAWTLGSPRVSSDTLKLLRSDARRLRRQAQDVASWWFTIVPAVLAIFGAVLLVIIQASLALGPFFEALYRMARQ